MLFKFTSNFRLKKILSWILLSFIVNGCAPLVPDNYLGPTTIQTSQKVNGKWLKPRLIPISVSMLNSPKGQELLEPAMRPQPYKIGPFDNLNIVVWGHPEISTIPTSPSALPNIAETDVGFLNSGSQSPPILVQTDGTIFFPYVGHLKVSGHTINEIQNDITSRLIKYIRNPQVAVQISKYRNRNMYVLGEVRAPGMQPITDKPLTLMEAISAAGGINASTADPTHIYLVRGSYQQPDVFWLNARSPQALLIAERFPIQENDIVYVSAATLNSWNAFVGQVLPNFSTYYTLKGLS